MPIPPSPGARMAPDAAERPFVPLGAMNPVPPRVEVARRSRPPLPVPDPFALLTRRVAVAKTVYPGIGISRGVGELGGTRTRDIHFYLRSTSSLLNAALNINDVLTRTRSPRLEADRAGNRSARGDISRNDEFLTPKPAVRKLYFKSPLPLP